MDTLMDLMNWFAAFLSGPDGHKLRDALLQAFVYLVVAVVGGQILISRYAIQRKQREQEIELARFIKERQYEALEQVYRLFGTFMQLYREINARDTDLIDPQTRKAFFVRAAEAEAAIDATILRIGSEFATGKTGDLETLLGNLRQGVQLWRETVREGEKLPFTHSDQADYMRFKQCFARTAAYLASSIYESLAPVKVKMDEAGQLLTGAFSNKFERRVGTAAKQQP
jgi:hypothetical protein